MKKLLFYIMTGLFVFTFINHGAPAARAAISDNGNGTVTVVYNNETTLRVKILVEGDGVQQQYDLPSGKNTIVVPLSRGNTVYTIKLCRQNDKGTYTVLEKQSITLNLSDKNQVFLYANAIVNFKQSDNILKRAAELTHGKTSEDDVVKAVHDYVIRTFSYNYDLSSQINAGTVTSYVPDVQSVYAAKTGICYDYSVVMASMLRSRGIEVRVVTGYPDPGMVNGYHAWLQIYDPVSKSWYTCDPTYDSAYYHKGLSYTLKKSDSLYSNITYIY